MRAVSKISSRNLCIGRHTCHRRVYLLWLDFICAVFRRLIYFLWCLRLFYVPVNLFIRSVQYLTICNKIILRSTSEAHIWFPLVAFILIIIRVAWIGGLFLIAFLLSLLLKSFLGWVWTSTVTALWLSKMFSIFISYLIFKIQIIDL